MTEQDQFQVAKKLKTLIQSEESIVSRFTDLEYCVYIEEEQALTIVNKSDVPLSPPVLSLEANQMIVNENCQNEHQLIVCFTPILEELSNECGLIFVNSEEFSWIRTLKEHPMNYLKPDGFSTIHNLYQDAGEDSRVNLENWKIRYPTTYRYGRGLWEIRNFYILWEFKMRIAQSDRGKAYSYLLHMCRKDSTSTFRCILCDRDDFYIMIAKGGIIVSVEKWGWTQPGSRRALLDILSFQNNWCKLFRSCIQKLNVKVLSFLGSGGYGRVFRVLTADGKEIGMKIVLTLGNEGAVKEQLILSEYDKLCQLKEQKVPHVVDIIDDSLTNCVFDGTLVGVGYLLSTIGCQVTKQQCQNKDFCKQLFQSLLAIHQHNYHHGDARFNNAIISENQIYWIDFVSLNLRFTSLEQKRKDFKVLIGSIIDDPVSISSSNLFLDSYYGISNDINDQRQVLDQLVDSLFS